MKILWVTNTIFPDLSLSLGNSAPVVGGWMYGLASDLVKSGIELTVVSARKGVPEHHDHINGITYYLLATNKQVSTYDASLEIQWKKVIEDTTPDVVHIHGTEFALGLALINTCPQLNYVISIQGLISVCYRYYTGNISKYIIRRHLTFRDILKSDSLLQAKKKFYNRGEQVEKLYFQKVNNFIGRTRWDLDHTKILNRDAKYHFCNESLRDSFYISEKWNITTKEKHTIFLSQALYPIKGLHQVIKAISLIKTEFPDIKIRVAGNNIIRYGTLRDKFTIGGYGNYIRKLMSRHGLEENIEFVGYLNEQEMIKEYLNCHLFICPSSIENSPNSLGEAQLLGVPSIGSYVGGIPDMIEHGETGLLYRFEEIEMLARAIGQVFNDDLLAQNLSKNSIEIASKRHNRENNLNTTLEIYDNVNNSKQIGS